MKFTCNTKDIASAVGAASKVVNAHTTVPILSNVLLQAEDGKIAVRATDLELTLEHAFPAEIGEGGSVTIPAKLFSSYLGELAGGTARAHRARRRAPSVKCERSNYDFHALPADEYPPLPAATQRLALHDRLPRSFRDGIEATIFAASSEEARGAVLMGTLLELEGNSLTMVATDGYRLAKLPNHARRRHHRQPRSTSSRRARWPKPRAISAAATRSRSARSARRAISSR